MIHHLDLAELLHLAETIPGGPQVDDYGALVSATTRPSAAVSDIECYQSVTGKAAALLQSLALLEPLEHSNKRYALIAALAFLEANGTPVKPDVERAAALLTNLKPGMPGVRAAARTLREWTAS